MQVKLDFRSGIPIYVQIMDQIKHLVATGVLRPDDQLPTVRQMASDLRINFNTVARAYRMLDEAGVISTQQGRGTYILDQPSPEAAERLRQQSLRALTHRYLARAFQLDFSQEEIQTAFEHALANWQIGESTEIEEEHSEI
jgi:GntR family transcriptional regulator